jgi:hypothetical protein
VSFLARWMAKAPPKGTKKSVYPKGVKMNRFLFGYEEARTAKRLILCEDVFSRMVLGKTSMATYGTHLSQYQLEMIIQTDAEEVILLWDRDATVRHGSAKAPPLVNGNCPLRRSGQRCVHCKRYEKTMRYAELLAEFFKVKVPQLPDARDPDEHRRRFSFDLIDATPRLNGSTAWKDSARSRLATL